MLCLLLERLAFTMSSKCERYWHWENCDTAGIDTH
jgi:hypothetical protein